MDRVRLDLLGDTRRVIWSEDIGGRYVDDAPDPSEARRLDERLNRWGTACL